MAGGLPVLSNDNTYRAAVVGDPEKCKRAVRTFYWKSTASRSSRSNIRRRQREPSGCGSPRSPYHDDALIDQPCRGAVQGLGTASACS